MVRAFLTNPLDQDPVLKDLLHKLDRIETRRGFARWKKHFLQQFEAHLEGMSISKAGQKYHSFARRLDRLVLLLKQLERLMSTGDLSTTKVTVKSRQSLSELQKQLTGMIEHTQALVPGTLEQENAVGYTKFDMGAVLVRDGFVEYDRLCLCRDVLWHMREALLVQVADRQLLEEMERYELYIDAFCGIMGNDLGLHGAMLKCRDILRAEDEEFWQYENEQGVLVTRRSRGPLPSVTGARSNSQKSEGVGTAYTSEYDVPTFYNDDEEGEEEEEEDDDDDDSSSCFDVVEIYGMEIPLRLTKRREGSSRDDINGYESDNVSDLSDDSSWSWSLQVPAPPQKVIRRLDKPPTHGSGLPPAPLDLDDSQDDDDDDDDDDNDDSQDDDDDDDDDSRNDDDDSQQEEDDTQDHDDDYEDDDNDNVRMRASPPPMDDDPRTPSPRQDKPKLSSSRQKEQQKKKGGGSGGGGDVLVFDRHPIPTSPPRGGAAGASADDDDDKNYPQSPKPTETLKWTINDYYHGDAQAWKNVTKNAKQKQNDLDEQEEKKTTNASTTAKSQSQSTEQARTTSSPGKKKIVLKARLRKKNTSDSDDGTGSNDGTASMEMAPDGKVILRPSPRRSQRKKSGATDAAVARGRGRSGGGIRSSSGSLDDEDHTDNSGTAGLSEGEKSTHSQRSELDNVRHSRRRGGNATPSKQRSAHSARRRRSLSRSRSGGSGSSKSKELKRMARRAARLRAKEDAADGGESVSSRKSTSSRKKPDPLHNLLFKNSPKVSGPRPSISLDDDNDDNNGDNQNGLEAPVSPLKMDSPVRSSRKKNKYAPSAPPLGDDNENHGGGGGGDDDDAAAAAAAASTDDDDEETIRRRKLCYKWYNRLGHPSRDAMKQRLRKSGPASMDGLTMRDVDLLPWIHNGARVNVGAITKMVSSQ